MLSTIFSVNVFAASYPSISSSKYIEFKAQQNINVYKDISCKTRGTSSPSKKYNASISSGDTCYIYKIEKNYIQVNYPTSSGRRTGYIKRNALFDETAPINYISYSKAKVTVHKSSSGSCIAKGDKVWEVDTKKEYSGYKAVIYEAKSGKRAYKLGYIKSNDWNSIIGKVSNTDKELKNNESQNSKVINANNLREDWLEQLDLAKNSANSVMEVVYAVNKYMEAEKGIGIISGAIITFKPSKLLTFFDKDTVLGAASLVISNAYYQEAIKAHNNFIQKSKSIKTEKQANEAFVCFVDSLSKYNAVTAANMDTVDRYLIKGNYKNDMIKSYLSSLVNSLVPASEYESIIKACETVNTTAELINVVDSKYSGYKELIDTKSRWYKAWFGN